MSCDLLTSLNLQTITNFFRVKNASFVTVLADNVEQSMELPVPGAKGKYAPERDIVGMDTATNRLLYFGAEADIEDIQLKTSVLKRYVEYSIRFKIHFIPISKFFIWNLSSFRYPKIVWTNKLHDSHLYVIKKHLLDYILDNKK